MRVFENREFYSDDLNDRDSAAVFEELEFRNCHFQSCKLSITNTPSLRSKVRNVRLIGCGQRGCTLYSAIVEDVLIDGFKTNGQLFQTWGAVFRHVVLRGKVDRVMISSVVDIFGHEPEVQEAFDDANAEYYRHVDWALDISQAEFKSFELRGLPTHLVRRDNESQVVVTREKALQCEWRKLDFKEGLWRTAIDLFLQREEPSYILVAPKRHPKFRNYLADLKLLQEAGMAEAD